MKFGKVWNLDNFRNSLPVCYNPESHPSTGVRILRASMGTLGPLCWLAPCAEPPCAELSRDLELFLPNPEINSSSSSEAGTRDRRCNNTVITAGSHHHFPSDVERGGKQWVGCEGRGPGSLQSSALLSTPAGTGTSNHAAAAGISACLDFSLRDVYSDELRRAANPGG